MVCCHGSDVITKTYSSTKFIMGKSPATSPSGIHGNEIHNYYLIIMNIPVRSMKFQPKAIGNQVDNPHLPMVRHTFLVRWWFCRWQKQYTKPYLHQSNFRAPSWHQHWKNSELLIMKDVFYLRLKNDLVEILERTSSKNNPAVPMHWVRLSIRNHSMVISMQNLLVNLIIFSLFYSFCVIIFYKQILSPIKIEI